jgi:hypothetical protein
MRFLIALILLIIVLGSTAQKDAGSRNGDQPAK